MLIRLLVLFDTLFSLLKSHRRLASENLALRQQVAMLPQRVKRPQVSWFDRVFWVLFAKYVERWRTMLHALHPDIVTRWHREGFHVLHVFVMLNHDRRQVVHFDVTARPTAQWTAQRLVEAVPWNKASKYLLRDYIEFYASTSTIIIRAVTIYRWTKTHRYLDWWDRPMQARL